MRLLGWLEFPLDAKVEPRGATFEPDTAARLPLTGFSSSAKSGNSP